MLHPTEITADEAAFGFELRESAAGALVVRTLGVGLQAVKLLTADGTIEYAICDAHGRPLYAGARSLAELKHRFRL